MNGNPFFLSLNQSDVSRSVSVENFAGAKGSGGMATDGCTADAARNLDPGIANAPLPKAEDLVII